MDPRKQAEGRGTNPILSGGRTIVLVFAIFFALIGFGMLYLQRANDEKCGIEPG